jgi:hypothetical protein
MLKRYWFAAIAFGIALGLTALPPPDARAQEQEKNQDVEIKIPFPPYRDIKETDKADETNKPCKQGEDDRKSNLCAQWKAADAAKESADWTQRTFLLGIVGAVIGVLTFVAAGAAAFYAKHAATATSTANTILLSEQRPWISLGLSAGMDVIFSGDRIAFGMAISMSNIGKRPAVDVHCELYCLNSFAFGDEQKLSAFKDGIIGEVESGKVRTDVVLPSEKISKNFGRSIVVERIEFVGGYGPYIPAIIAMAVYRIDGESEWRSIATVFNIFRRSDDEVGLGVALDPTNGSVAKENINIVRVRNAIAT